MYPNYIDCIGWQVLPYKRSKYRGLSVITSLNAADFRQLITSIVEDAAALPVVTEQAGNEAKKEDVLS